MRQFAVDLSNEGTQVGVLSNNVIEWEPHWRAMVDLDEVATAIIDSCKVGVRKPDPGIFTIAANTAGVHPEDCLLIDDLPENCAAARKAGWTAVHYLTAEQAITEVRNALTSSTPKDSHRE
jgi:putative hydrolase of the HAD superfamily